MKNNKLLFILPSFGLGGAEKNTLFLANHYVNIGYDVAIVVLINDIKLKEKLSPLVKFFNLNKVKMRNGLIPLIKILRAYKPTTVYVNLWPITLISLIAKLLAFNHAKFIFVEHINLRLGLEKSTKLEKLIAKISHLTFRLINANFVAVSQGVKNDLVNHYKLQERNVKVIYNPVITSLPTKYNLSSNRFSNFICEIKILAIGNLKIQKDYDNLISSISILKDRGLNVRCNIIGEGEERIRLERLINNLNLHNNIKLLGQLIDVEEYYISTDVFVLSSAYEGLGNVLIEALSYGCRIVSTDCESGPREILKDGMYGFIVEKGNPIALANGIEKSLSYKIDQITLRKRSLDFLVSKIGRQYLDI